MPEALTDPIGPILFLDDLAGGQMRLSALVLAPPGQAMPPVEPEDGPPAPCRLLAEVGGIAVWRARFTLPADRPGSYRWAGETYPVAADLRGDLRIGFVSCNGQERGDHSRDADARNAMWTRLAAEHGRAPLSLLLHGGDQIYADELPRGHPLGDAWPALPHQAPTPDDLDGFRDHLWVRFARRYATLYRGPGFAHLAARVPSLMQWDDHDICDGWGSLGRRQTEGPVGRALFGVARDSFLLFQQAARDGDLPARFAAPAGAHLGWRVQAPGLRIVAPDLRSERRRDRIMGPGGWAMMEAERGNPAPGRTLLLSSVPLLGPRLSVLETLMGLVPGMQKYEDDLRDQWQSRAHRAEWRRMLALVRELAQRGGGNVTAVSGEIHLATRAEMLLGDGLTLHQLVASGIAHDPPPRGWARALGALASLGAAPLPDAPIRVGRLPGQRARYLAERNYLLLERRGGDWQARWDLEDSGMTPPLPI